MSDRKELTDDFYKIIDEMLTDQEHMQTVERSIQEMRRNFMKLSDELNKILEQSELRVGIYKEKAQKVDSSLTSLLPLTDAVLNETQVVRSVTEDGPSNGPEVDSVGDHDTDGNGDGGMKTDEQKLQELQSHPAAIGDPAPQMPNDTDA